MTSVIWSPQPKQALFMSRPEFESLYGGAAGGGKSDALVIEGTRQVSNAAYQGLIMRKTYPELTELINRSLELYPKIFPGARYNDSKHVWSFPGGAKIYFGSMQHSKDKLKYQGRQYQFIGIDEATHFTLEEIDFLKSRCRARAPGQRCYFRLTANPGGPGHGWVKSRYIDVGANKRVWESYEITDPSGKKIIQAKDRIYIPATVFDNRKLLENDPNYLSTLAALNTEDRNAFLYGNWDSFSGQVFTEWKNEPEHYQDQKYTHVIEPFDIPDNWRIWRSYDFGYSKPFSAAWYAISPDDTIYLIKEYYGWNGTPDKGLQWEPRKQAEEIKKMEQDDPLLKRFNIFGVADPAIWERSSGESIAHIMEMRGIYFSKADNSRIPGKMQCHYRLAFDPNGRSKFYVFNTCKQFIRTIPTLVYDQTHVEDIDSTQEDHIYDQWRYLLMQHPIAPSFTLKTPKPYNPLDTDSNYDPYSWVRKLI